MTSKAQEVLTFKSATIDGLKEAWRNFWEPLMFAGEFVKRVVTRLT